MFIIVLWITWFMILFRVLGDIFRRHDIGGFSKVIWIIFVILLPFLGVFIYLITQGGEMAQRDMKDMRAAQGGVRRLRQVGGRERRRGGRDREGEGLARQRCDHPGRVRRAQGRRRSVSCAGGNPQERIPAWIPRLRGQIR